MSLENEYYSWKQRVAREEKSLAQFEATEIVEDENNPFSVKERLQAKEKGIASCKENIKEYEEILEEIKEELIEFINNGGEVSEKTKEEIGYFESFDVSFKIISNRNDEVYCEGYVTINDEEADVDWYFWDGSQYSSQRKIHHDGIQITGSTVKQENEIAEFESDIADDGIWIDDCILQSDDDENRTYIRENVTLIINDGAKFEVEYEDYNSKEWDSDYYMAFTLKYNGEKVFLDEDVYFQDPYTYEHYKVGEDVLFENGAYIVEIPKGYWEDDEWDGNEIIKEYKTSFERAYVLSLVRELSVYGIASNIIKEKLLHSEDPVQAMNEGYIDKFASAWEQDFEDMDVAELYFMSSDDVEKIIKKEL